MKKLLTTLLVSLSLLLLSQQVIAGSAPVPTVRDASLQVLDALKKNKANLKTNPDYVHRVVKQYIIPHVDVTGMSRSVLGRKAWYGASLEQRKRFSREFVSLVIRTYSKALKNYSGESVRFMPLRSGYQGKRFVTVSSVISRDGGKDIPLKYALVKKSAGWKVYDLSVEGVSLLQSFRSQFRRELQMGSLNQLIAKLNEKNKQG